MTASTPGSASAALVSMRSTRAWGYCVLRMAPWSRPGSVTSWRNCVCPVTFSAPSRFGVSLPMTLKLTAVRLAEPAALPAHPRHLALPPLGATHEAGSIPTQRLGLLEDGLHRLLDVERLGHRQRRGAPGCERQLHP